MNVGRSRLLRAAPGAAARAACAFSQRPSSFARERASGIAMISALSAGNAM